MAKSVKSVGHLLILVMPSSFRRLWHSISFLTFASHLTFCDNGTAFHQIAYKNCKSQFEVVQVAVSDCAQTERCVFTRDKEYQIRIGFIPNRPVEQLKTAVWAHLGDARGALIKFHMENENACIGSNITCPLETGQTYWYRQSVFILIDFPQIDVQVNWLLLNPAAGGESADAAQSEQRRWQAKLPQRREVCVKFLSKVMQNGN